MLFHGKWKEKEMAFQQLSGMKSNTTVHTRQKWQHPDMQWWSDGWSSQLSNLCDGFVTLYSMILEKKLLWLGWQKNKLIFYILIKSIHCIFRMIVVILWVFFRLFVIFMQFSKTAIERFKHNNQMIFQLGSA